MAVRIFEVTETESARLAVLEPAPLRRQDLRRSKQRYAALGLLILTLPFVAALCVLGVAH
ncbi:MAG TPA: hypothetical protein VGE75_01900 [Acidimicrobiales bacterium]|jgi:hypothetical protein